MRRAYHLFAAAALALAGCSSQPAADTGSAGSAACRAGDVLDASDAGLRQTRLCIETADGTLPFTIELAETPEEQARGLMFRTELDDDSGMLFPFPRERVASFWMKNTVIPLDLLFIRRDGTIESIAANAIPYDESPLASGEPVIAVLELRGGLAAEKGITPGDTVRWAANDG